jgi:hypothetical protein
VIWCGDNPIVNLWLYWAWLLTKASVQQLVLFLFNARKDILSGIH